MRRIISVAFALSIITACNLPVTNATVLPITTSAADPTSAAGPLTSAAERWREYENALAEVFLPLPYLPGQGLCEWELLGQSEREVYVLAMCQEADSSEGAAMSAPAVIHLGSHDEIDTVEVPGDGYGYQTRIQQMFPPELHERILSQSISAEEMWTHLQLRHQKPGVPLIVASGVSLP